MKKSRGALTEGMEDYLKSVCQLQAEGREVTTSLLAEALALSAPSVSYMLKKLTEHGLVAHAPYGNITLTPAGEKIAREVLRRHRLIEAFLQETLHLPANEADVEAHHLEHELSTRLEKHIATFLGEQDGDRPTKGTSPRARANPRTR